MYGATILLQVNLFDISSDMISVNVPIRMYLIIFRQAPDYRSALADPHLSRRPGDPWVLACPTPPGSQRVSCAEPAREDRPSHKPIGALLACFSPSVLLWEDTLASPAKNKLPPYRYFVA